jgi:hypothetical protein
MEALCQLGIGFQAEMDIFSALGYGGPKLIGNKEGSKAISRFVINGIVIEYSITYPAIQTWLFRKDAVTKLVKLAQ